jgi:hypothetical protein
VRDKEPVWEAVIRRHDLVPTPLHAIADWAFADFHWSQRHDVVSDLTKLRNAGFSETIDSRAMLLSQLHRYREARILP